jgi:uncharacterized HAD superfamily protein
MKILDEVSIPAEQLDYLEMLSHELEGYKNIVTSTLHDDFKYNVEIHDHFMQKYQEANMAFIFARQELLEEYFPEYLDRTDTKMNILFHKGTVQIIVDEGLKCCN